jgi:hypothetical protein
VDEIQATLIDLVEVMCFCMVCEAPVYLFPRATGVMEQILEHCVFLHFGTFFVEAHILGIITNMFA